MAQVKTTIAEVRNPISRVRANKMKAKHDLMDDLLDAIKTTSYTASGALSPTDGLAILKGGATQLAMTLVDGTTNYETVLVAVRSGTAKITPTTLAGGSEIVMAAGELVKLVWINSTWNHIAHTGSEGEFLLAAHGLNTADGDFYLASSGTLPAGSVALTKYWVIKLTNDKFQLATSSVNATAGTAINLTSAGSGTITLTRPVSVSAVTNVASVKASLDLGPLTVNVDTVIEDTVAGVSSKTLTLVHDGGAPAGGTLSNIGNAYTFTFLGGTTTVANLEGALGVGLAVKTASGSPTNILADTDDEFVAQALTGGVDPVDEFTSAAHGIPDETKVRIEAGSGGVIPTGLAALTDYWAIVGGDPNKISLAASLVDAQNGVAVNITTTGTLPLRILHLAYKTITSVDFAS